MVPDMAAKEFIASVTKVLVTRARPERVYLIGSFARGQEDCDSDIDLLVVKDTDLPRHKRARELRKMIAPYKYPLDLLVYSRDEFEKEKNVAGTLAYQAVREGILLSRSPHQVSIRSGDGYHRSHPHAFPISSG